MSDTDSQTVVVSSDAVILTRDQAQVATLALAMFALETDNKPELRQRATEAHAVLFDQMYTPTGQVTA